MKSISTRLFSIFALLSGFFATNAGAEKLYGRLSEQQKSLVTQVRPAIQARLESDRSKLELTEVDIQGWTVSDIYSSSKAALTYVYIQQEHSGIRVFNAVSTFSLRNGQVLSFAPRFVKGLSGKINTTVPSFGPSEAIIKALNHLALDASMPSTLETKVDELNKYVFTIPTISRERVIVTLVYLPVEDRVRLAWNISIAPIGQKHWWNLRFDATTGDFLQKNDWNVSCDFGQAESPVPASPSHPSSLRSSSTINPSSNSLLPVYNVYAFPLEAPSFGSRSLLSSPADPGASPYGWHDTDGNPGDEFTTTQGNNVFAYDDIANQDAPGSFADGGAPLNFDFPINLTQTPASYLEASLTNLFYVNNRIHDVLFHYGLDEAGGNFQVTNYSGQGSGNDQVLAEGQDGGGTNNANFATPDDGQNGRMQMYLWSGSSVANLQINFPSSIAGSYSAIEAGFGPAISAPITADLVLVDDGTAPISDACDPIQNGSALAGKIAVIDRGTCTFISKVNAAEAQGAIAVVVCNNQAGSPIAMGGTGTSNIPAVMISQADGNTLKAVLSAGGVVNGTLNPPSVVNQEKDGSLDNGIVAHEFGHGVSNRLTGGPNNSNCLFNGEQAGEGWSDYFALLFTIEPGDAGADARGIGTYALNQSVSGSGIRNYPYSTDMNINPQTYADLASTAGVHDVGEIWCVTLWDLTWDLISQFGFDPDWINGTGGNNIALSLVMEGMKLQPCGPGFLDGRDAILQADVNLYGGVHKCIIWSAFARRGMGANALQGSPDNTADETEDFSLPSFCQIPTVAPTADFSSDVTSTCSGIVRFTDQSTDIAQSWLWDFGDGATSTLQNPSHTYTAPGTFSVTLIVTNTLGSDTLVRNAFISVTTPAAPTVTGNSTVCSGATSTLSATLIPGDDAQWSDSSGAVLSTGSTFTTPSVTSNVTYYVRQFTPTPAYNVGPVNGSFGGGGYHNTSFEGRQIFTTFVPCRIKSVWVDASGTANRTFNLYGSNGSLIRSSTISVPAGQSRVTLDFDIPTPGNYQLGVVAGSNLFRNNSGAVYPYSVAGLLSITSSNSTSSPSTFYYYVYDWQVQELPCLSQPAAFSIEVSPNPSAAFSVADVGLSCSFIDNSTGAVASYSWDFGDGSVATSQNPQHNYAQPGTYSITLTVTTADGCTSTSSQSITLSLSGVIQLTSSNVTVVGGSQQVDIYHSNTIGEAVFVTIYDLTGRELVSRMEIISERTAIPVRSSVNSVVIVRIEAGGEEVRRQVLVTE
ncbi:MAG: T9SS-dependent M36 family metallopeptidase [Bacteroidota bacterium]